MLKNSFYYGEFEYPINSGKWYQGKHPPLITKQLFEKVQEQLVTSQKSPWGEKIITFKGLFKCGTCGSNIIGEEKWRKRKWAEPRKHVYYHCARQLNMCPEPYLSEDKLIKQILRYLNFMNIAHPKHLKLTQTLKSSVFSYIAIREEVFYGQEINPNDSPVNVVEFAAYVLRSGSTSEKRDIVLALDRQLYIKNQFISSLTETT